MAFETAAMRELFTRDFGVDLSIEPPGGGVPITVPDGQGGQRLPRGIFENGYLGLDDGGEPEVSTTEPSVTVPDHELPGVDVDWEVTVGGMAWVVIELQPDGTGFTIVKLHEKP